MLRLLVSITAVTMFSAGAAAQCLDVTSPGTLIGQGDDITFAPHFPLGFAFPMNGSYGPLAPYTHFRACTNGWIMLTNGVITTTLPTSLSGSTTQMVGILGDGPRIMPFWGDNNLTVANNGNLYYDNTTNPGVSCKVTWVNSVDYGQTVLKNISCELFATGEVKFSYSSGMNVEGPANRFVGISPGNGVALPAVSDFSSNGVSPDNCIYESFATGTFDLGGGSFSFLPTGGAGWVWTRTCTGAYHEEYGAGCYNIPAVPHEAVYEYFATPADTSSQLPGTSITLTPTGTGYAIVNGGGAYVTPTGAATTLALGDDTEVSVTPSLPFPHVSGAIATVAVSSNGNINMAASPSGNSTTAWGDVAALLNAAVASFRSNADYDPANSPGQIKSEELSNILFITWEDVERYGAAQNGFSDRLQFQLNLLSGVVVIVWDAMANAGSGTSIDTVVGYTPGGGSIDGGSIDLATALPIVTSPDEPAIAALTLSASPPPVFVPAGPSVPITYQVDNLRDLSPALPGFYLSSLVFSFNPPIVPGGIDLTFVGIDAPGCNLLVGSLDVLYSITPTASSHGEVIVVPQPLSPGTTFYVQAANFILPNSLPGGLNGFGLIVSNGVKSYFELN